MTVRPGNGTITPEIERAIRLLGEGIYRAYAAGHHLTLWRQLVSVLACEAANIAEIDKDRARIEGQNQLAIQIAAITREHTEQMKLLAAVYERDHTNVARFAAVNLVPWRAALLEITPPDPAATLTFNNAVMIDARPAKQIAKVMKADAKKQRAHLAKGGPLFTGWMATVSTAVQLPPPMKLGMRA